MRAVARLLAAVLAVLGALPLGVGVLVRAAPLRAWAARETSALLARELGVAASFEVRVSIFPLALEVSRLKVEGTDGLGPALAVARLTVRPRPFALVAGRLDAGDVEVEAPRVRLVVEQGQVRNLAWRTPKRAPSAAPEKRLPFSTLALTDASVELTLDGTRVSGREIDVDVAAREGPAFDVALRAGEHTITRQRPVLAPGAPAGAVATDDDVVCRVQARASIDARAILVRRLSALAVADDDDAPGTAGRCDPAKDDPRRVELEVGHLLLKLEDGAPTAASGHVAARAPGQLVNRQVAFMPLRGWVGVDVDARWERGMRLPELHGSVSGAGLEMAEYRLASHLDAQVDVDDDVVRVRRFEAGFANGKVIATDAEIRPFAPKAPIHIGVVDSLGLDFPGLMRDLGVTQHTIVAWTFDRGHITQVGGTLAPLRMEGDMVVQTSGFEVYDHGYDDPRRHRMIGVREAKLVGRIGVHPDAMVFNGVHVTFGRSSMDTTVAIGFHDTFDVTVTPGSTLDFGDVTPIAKLPFAGRATVGVDLHGRAGDVLLTGDLSVAGFELGGFPLGDITSSRVRFRPLVVDLLDVRATKGVSTFELPSARLDFDGPSTLVVDADVDARELDLRDFLHMWHFDQDPRFQEMRGVGSSRARVHLDMGGVADRCGGGLLEVRADTHFDSLELFGEKYDGGEAAIDWRWLDRDAQDLGMALDVPHFTLRKGKGAMFGSATVRPGGILRAEATASDIPIGRVQSMGPLATLLDGTSSAVAKVSGTLSEIAVDADVHVSPVRVGAATLPASHVQLTLVPTVQPRRVIGHTRCGQPISPPFDRAEYAKDLEQGVFHVSGDLLGGQIALDDLQMTRQQHKTARGTIRLAGVDVGALASALPSSLVRDDPPKGSLSGKITIDALPLDEPQAARGKIELAELDLASGAGRVTLREGTPPLVFGDDGVEVPRLALDVVAASGFRTSVVARGRVRDPARHPDLDLEVEVPPTELATLAPLLARVERASGTFGAKLTVRGPPASAAYEGALHIARGELALRGMPLLVSDVDLEVVLGGGEARIARGTASLGGGTLVLSGRAPLRGLEVGDASATLVARGVHLPVVDGIDVALDADLAASLPTARREDEARPLPRVTGDVTLASFTYSRPITIAADLGSLAQRARRKSFDAYDPADDAVAFDLRLRAREPLRLRNNLVEAMLALDSDALALTGTNQRFGLRGQLRVVPGGHLRLRANDFEVRQGTVRFDDASRIAPTVDITAVTEYRRYSESQAGSATGGASSGGGAAGAVGRSGGLWRITLHAFGDADNLRLDMSSEPALAQEDIVLLLTIGMTRAEVDQLQASSVGETAALEALSALTGADTAVKSAIPVVDDFRFGSAYSSRTGRTEPTVTIGKRVTDRVRATVTSGLSDNREVRTNVEWRLGPRVSVQGNYDNVNDVASSGLGNLGADVRWRLEFE